MKYLGIDLGDKRVGIAKAGEEGFAFAYKIVPRTRIIQEIRECLQYFPDLETLVVGLPYDLYGKDTKQLEKTIKFIEKLKAIFPNLSVVGYDERFSSFLADEGNTTHRDDIAAQIILQSFLDKK